jgi:V/A-type H+-transporting ATPase subunit B
VVGEEGLSAADTAYLAFGDAFEAKVIQQDGPRSLAASMAAGWQALRHLPRAELHRLSDAEIDRHLSPLGARPGAPSRDAP